MALRIDRKLAAIMVVDIVGYSKLVGIDEVGTLARVRAHISMFANPIVSEHGGRVVKLTGDGLLAEFSSAIDAVECAVAMQNGMLKREASEPEERRIRFRIGINLGDVIHQDGDIFGDSVNIAVRLEALAEPGGICIERSVYDHVKSKLKLGFHLLGQHRVKNIEDPVTVYRVGLNADVSTKGRSPRLGWRAAIPAFLMLLTIGVSGYWFPLLHPTTEPGRPAQRALDIPSIVVLPFINGSGDLEMDHFSDGITEDLMIGLSKSPEILVASRSTSFSYKGKSSDVRSIGEELGVRYVLEGSVRKNTNTVRITAQLIDATSGFHVWAEQYENEGSDIFLMQDEIANLILNSLLGGLGEVKRAEIERAWSTKKTSVEEYEILLRGHSIMRRRTKEDTARAREIWSAGMDKYPDSGSLPISTAWALFNQVRQGWSPNAEADLEEAWELASSGIAVDNLPRRGQFYGHWILANLSVWYLRDYERAIAEAEKTLAIFPGYSDSLAGLSRIYLYSAQPSVALKNIDEAFQRNPKPDKFYNKFYGWGRFMEEDYEEAVRWLLKAKSNDFEAKRLLAASYAHLGEGGHAEDAVRELLELNPRLTVAGLREQLPYKQPEDLERELLGLSDAGLPFGNAKQ